MLGTPPPRAEQQTRSGVAATNQGDLNKVKWYQTAVKPSFFHMYPEVGHYSTDKARITAHNKNGEYYAVTSVEMVNMDDEPFTMTNTYKADTLEDIQACIAKFAEKFPN